MSAGHSVLNETARMALDVAERMLEDLGPTARGTGDATALWKAFDDTGFTQMLVPESAGGLGLPWAAAGALFELAGRWAVPSPFVETVLAARVLCDAGFPAQEGRVVLSLQALPEVLVDETPNGDAGNETPNGDAGTAAMSVQVRGTLADVPWARAAHAVLAPARCHGTDGALLVPLAHARVTLGANLAGEARDDLAFDGHRALWVPAGASVTPSSIRALGAAARSAQMAGALDALLALSLDYAGVREQFGRSLDRYQVIQHALAQLGTMAWAARAAAASAFQALDDAAQSASGQLPACPSMLLPVAAAKVYCGDVVGTAASLAHQIFGAIGFTQEHVLHRCTTRLWAWRDEYGSEAYWAAQIGQHTAPVGAQGLWATATGTWLPRAAEVHT